MSENLKLWNEVQETNPKYTKNAKLSGMKITAIAPQYQIMMVTEKFGVYGEKWGFKEINLDYSLLDHDIVVFKGIFFFPGGEYPIINSCKLFMDRNKQMIDDNFAKKIETDSLTKAISKLGFNADIFMGKFDDVRYVEEMNIKHGNKEPEKPTPTKQDAITAMKSCKSIDEVKACWSKFKQFQNVKDFISAKDEMKTKF